MPQQLDSDFQVSVELCSRYCCNACLISQSKYIQINLLRN